MSAQTELAGILEQWLQLTREESAAITAATWPLVKQIQTRKTALREALANAMRQCPRDDATSAPLRARAARILSLLTRNAEAMAAQLRQARDRQETLDETKRNLGRIQRSYLRPGPTAWQSYS